MSREASSTCAVLRLMTYNVEMGLAWPAALELIRAHPVDVLCLQEIPEEAHPDRRLVRPARVVKDVGLPHDLRMLWYREPRRVGNATFVRGRVAPGPTLCIPLSKPYGMESEVEVGGTRLTVANIHLTEMLGPPLLAFPISEMYRLREAQDLTRRFARCDGPVVAMGDFNTFWPAPAAFVLHRDWRDCRAEVGGRHAATRPTYGLPFVIDHVLVRGDVKVRDYRVIGGPGSDHRAVLVELDVRVR